MRNSIFLRITFALGLGLLSLSKAHAVEFENCQSQGPIIFGTYAKQSPRTSIDPYHSGLGGLGFIWDVYSMHFAKFGLSLTGASSRVVHGDTATSFNIKEKITYLVPGCYGRLHYGWFFLYGFGGVGPTHFKTGRTLISNGTVIESKSKGMLGSLKASTGIAIPLYNFEITPLVMIDHATLKKGTRVETGGTTTAITSGGDIRAQQQSFGLRFAEISEPNIFYPEMHIFTFRDSHQQKLRVISRFLEGVPSFVQDGITPSSSGMNVGGSISSSILGAAILLTAGFDYETRKGFQSYAAFLRLRFF